MNTTYEYRRICHQKDIEEVNNLLKEGWTPLRETQMGETVLVLLKSGTTASEQQQQAISLADQISNMCRSSVHKKKAS